MQRDAGILLDLPTCRW